MFSEKAASMQRRLEAQKDGRGGEEGGRRREARSWFFLDRSAWKIGKTSQLEFEGVGRGLGRSGRSNSRRRRGCCRETDVVREGRTT